MSGVKKILLIVFTITIFWGCIESQENKRVKEVVTQAINELNKPADGHMVGALDKSFLMFPPDYWQLLYMYPRYKIKDFTLKIKNDVDINVEVIGTILDQNGNKVDIVPKFVLVKSVNNNYNFKDSYNFVIFPSSANLPSDKSDMEKANLIIAPN